MVLGNINIHAQNPDFLFMVEYAIKAPSGHNTQPWLFRINENSIEIHPNFDMALPVVDFDNRELFINRDTYNLETPVCILRIEFFQIRNLLTARITP